MLPGIVAASVRARLLLLPVVAGLLIAGGAHLAHMPKDVLPELSAPTVEIQVESLGLSAPEVEQLLTVPLEQFLLNGVRGVETIRSDSIPGLARVQLVFPRGSNVLEARQLVQERLNQTAALPNVATPPQMLQPVSSTSRVMMIGLSASKLSPIDLSTLARWVIKPRLLGLPGVANVAVWGQRDQQLQVLVDPQRLRARHVSLNQIVSTAGNAQLVSPLSFLGASTPGTGGFIDGPNQRLSIRHVLPFGVPSKLAAVPIESTHGLRLGRVASVVVGHQPLIGDALVHGHQGLLLAVDKRPGTSTVDVTRRVQQAIDKLRPGLTGVRIDPTVFRPATFVATSVNRLRTVVLMALVLMALALGAFFLEFRAVAVALIVIPLSLLSALLVLDLFGQTLNALVVAGLLLALGLVVDDALSLTEGLAHHLPRRDRRAADADESARDMVVASSSGIGRSLVYSGLVAGAAAAPLLIAQGLTASFVRPLALSFAVAVAVSVLIALVVTPTLGLALLSFAPRARPNWFVRLRVSERYGALVTRVGSLPRGLLLALAAVGLVGLVSLPLLGSPARPTFPDRDLVVRWQAAAGTSLSEMNRITRLGAARLQNVPGVREVNADIGRATTSDRLAGTDAAQLWVRMDPGADYGDTLADIRRVARTTPGLSGTVSSYEDDRNAGILASADPAVTVRVYGQDYRVLRDKATELAHTFGGIQGVRDTRVTGLPAEQASVQIEVNLTSALRHNIKTGDVRRAVATLVSGLTVGNFFQEQKVFDVVVRGVPATRNGVASVRNLLLNTPGGGYVRLHDVARVRVLPNPVDIRHDAVSRYVDVRLGVSGDVDAVRREVARRLSTASFPLENHAELLGQSVSGQTSHWRFATFVMAALIAAFLLLQAALGSWAISLAVLLSAPLAALGGLLVALVIGRLDSLGALAGLVGIAVLSLRHSLMLGAAVGVADDSDPALDQRARVLGAARARLAPTIMSIGVTGAGVLPFVLVGGVAGNAITRPMAAVLLGGLVTSALVNLLIVPAIYAALGSTEPEGERVAEPSAGPADATA